MDQKQENVSSTKFSGPDWVVLAIPILVIPFIYTRELIDPVVIPRFLALALFLFLFLLLILRKYSGESVSSTLPMINNRAMLSALLLILISGISLSYSTNIADGLFEWLKLVLSFCFLALLIIYFQNSKQFFHQLSKMITVFSLISSAIGIYQFILLTGHDDLTHASVYTVSATFAHKNLFAQILLFTLPFCAYSAITFKSTFKILGILAIFLALCNITVSLSRGVWMATAIAIFATGIFAFVIERHKNSWASQLGKRLFWPLTIFIVAVSVSILLYSNLDSFETIQRQVLSIFNAEHSATKDRLMMWEKSYQLFKENPLSGSGMGTWKIELLKLGTEGMRSSDGSTFFQRPHNDFIWVLVECGIFGLLSFISFFVFCFYYLFRVIKHSTNPDHKRIGYLMFFGLCSYVLCSMFSFPKERIEHLVMLSFIVAPILILHNTYEKPKVVNPLITHSGFPIMALLLVLSMIIGTKRMNGEHQLKKALQAREEGDWNSLIDYSNQAESAIYHMDPTSTPIAWYRGLAYYNIGNQQAAFDQFQNAYEIHPYHIHVLNNLATSYEILGNHNQAIHFYTKAVQISPNFEEALLNLSVVLYQQGRIDDAYQYLRKIDVESTNDKFRYFVNIIVKPATERFIKSIDERVLIMMLRRILNSNEWLYNTHAKSVANNRSFNDQLLVDSFHILTMEDEILTLEEAERLKTKYLALL